MNNELAKIRKLIEEHRKDIEKFEVVRIGIFGSIVRGDYDKNSDVDILVVFDKVNLHNYMGLKFYLEDLFGRKVDLVIEKDLREELQYVRKEAVYAWCISLCERYF